METILEKSLFFNVIDPPNLRITAPRWLQMPSPMQAFAFVLLTYFLVTGGVVYDIINEPPSIGSEVDERGNNRPVAIMKYRVNGQYIMEGLAASFMFSFGAIGFIILDLCNNPLTSKNNRIMLLGLGFSCVLISFMTTRMFMKMKLPDYMN
ncbi:OST3 / OST6 family, transporter family domain-containing protein [Ditylenchus destructor]|uniref:Oligosaccharyltransferase complex subunit n=1 Tax=Ditylenchus destructor TaxID=166010 RepID=A0AAD4R6M5_9BILA|nr:OST3 / OST6 family, transporter family domain-containing protein [Ditylenchus destructor]